jgi:uncharacterized metal-binding protein
MVDKDGRFFFKDVPDNMSCSVKGWSKESGRFYEVDPGSFKYTCEPLGKAKTVEKKLDLMTIFRHVCEAVIVP